MCAAHQADNQRSAFARAWKGRYTLLQTFQFWDFRSIEFPLVFTHSVFFLAREMKIIRTTLPTFAGWESEEGHESKDAGNIQKLEKRREKICHIDNAALDSVLWDSSQDADRTTDDNQSVVFNLQTLAITYSISRKLMQPCHSHSDFTLRVFHFLYFTILKK